MDTSTSSQPDHAPQLPQVYLWLQATLEEVEAVDFEAPIANSPATRAHEIEQLYHAAVKEAEARQDVSAARVFSMLAAVTSMFFRPRDVHEPFGPMMVMTNGRSPAPSDYRGHVEQLASMARRAKHPVLRARLSDLTWLLDRKQAVAATAAIDSYIELVDRIRRQKLNDLEPEDLGVLGHDVQEYVRRALQIGRAIGWDKPSTLAARKLAVDLRKLALQRRKPGPIYWFSYLDLDFDLSPSAAVSADLEAYLALTDRPDDVHNVVGLWRLATMGYHHARQEEDKVRCQVAAADRLEAEAKAKSNSPMLAAHFLTSAVVQLNSVKGQKERRKALKHQLIDAQSNISDEMSFFGVPLEVQDEAEAVRKALTGTKLVDKLFLFGALARSPSPDTLIAEAQEQLKKHPLSGLFGTNHLDRDGKTISRTEAGGYGDSQNNGAIRNQIAQAERLRRQIAVASALEPARQVIFQQHHISDDVFAELLHNSPFVPLDLMSTYARGFSRFFQGDFVSALYILTPLLEASLRYVLKNHGYDVTVLDDTSQIQQDRTLSTLFSQMRNELDTIFTKAITTDIDNVFLARPGPALRHSLAHGLLDDQSPYGPDAIYACWLMFTLCLMPLYPDRDKIVLHNCD
jgi:hypothetical protein